VTLNQVCGMFGLFFTSGEVSEFDHAANADVNRFNNFFHAMLNNGVYLAPSAFEAGFISTAHDDAILDATLDAAEASFATLAD
jgi:glutamate-1-semialdehyde 2,1-aminomutase